MKQDEPTQVSRRMRIGILGGMGFLGSRLAVHLISLGHEVTIFTRRSRFTLSSEANTCHLSSRLPGNWTDGLAGINAVVDFISVGHWEFADEGIGREVSIRESAEQLIGVLRDAGVGKYVFVSSGGSVYGEWAGAPWREADPARPLTRYGRSKWAWERQCLSLSDHVMPVVVARPANAYGPAQMPRHGQGIVAAVVWSSICGVEAEIWGGLEVSRDFIQVDDLADGLGRAVQVGIGGERYNFGSQRETTMRELLVRLSEALAEFGLRVRVKVRQDGESAISRSALDCRKAMTDLGWPGTRLLDRGLREMLDELLRPGSGGARPSDELSLTLRALRLRWEGPKSLSIAG